MMGYVKCSPQNQRMSTSSSSSSFRKKAKYTNIEMMNMFAHILSVCAHNPYGFVFAQFQIGLYNFVRAPRTEKKTELNSFALGIHTHAHMDSIFS